MSTLGKIEVLGADAPAFLDFIYTGMISTLGVGRIRYGLMLRDDGFAFDDGTVGYSLWTGPPVSNPAHICLIRPIRSAARMIWGMSPRPVIRRIWTGHGSVADRPL